MEPTYLLAYSKLIFSLNGVKKVAENPYFKSMYADLQEILQEIKEPLIKNGFVIMQKLAVKEGKPVLVTRLLHESGYSEESVCPIIMSKEDPQAFGSSVTYMRRYSIATMLGLYQVDDDGNAGAGKISQDAKIFNKTEQWPDFDTTTSTQVPAAITGKADPGEYIVQCGKAFKGKKVKDIPELALREYIDWASSQEKLSQKVQEFFNNATAFLAGK